MLQSLLRSSLKFSDPFRGELVIEFSELVTQTLEDFTSLFCGKGPDLLDDFTSVHGANLLPAEP